jgi:hypothetical protein
MFQNLWEPVRFFACERRHHSAVFGFELVQHSGRVQKPLQILRSK